MPNKKWAAEGNDAALLAQAILSGVVTDDLQSFKDFFDAESSGPGAAIGEKYNYNTKTGQQEKVSPKNQSVEAERDRSKYRKK